MATLAIASLLTLLDSVAKQVELCETAFGATGAEVGTIAKGGENNVATILAAADIQVQSDLASIVQGRALNLRAAVAERILHGAPLQRALDRHYGGVGGLNEFLLAEDDRVHPLLRNIGFRIDPLRAFSPTVIDPVATAVLTAPGLATFTAGTPIDTTLYGKARMRLRTTTLIGATPITVTLSMKTEQNTFVLKQVVVPNGAASGTEADIGTAGVDLYIACVGITVAGGTAADGLKVISQIERVVAL